MENISMLCPTRKRPDNVRRLMKSVYDTADNPEDLEFVFYIDNDDDSYDDMEYLRTVRGERIVLAQMWNECCKVANGPLFFLCGDDLIFRTPHWDTLVRQAFNEFPDRIAYVHGRDASPHDGIFGTHGVLHRNWVNTVGYFVPPYFSADYVDTWLNDLANRLGRRVFIEEILTEHMHPNFGKADFDVTHQERMKRHEADHVVELYHSEEMEKLREADYRKLLGVLA